MLLFVVQLSKDHAKHVQAFESKLQRNLKDRQEAFEATYHEEIQNYKHTGQTKCNYNNHVPFDKMFYLITVYY